MPNQLKMSNHIVAAVLAGGESSRNRITVVVITGAEAAQQ